MIYNITIKYLDGSSETVQAIDYGFDEYSFVYVDLDGVEWTVDRGDVFDPSFLSSRLRHCYMESVSVRKVENYV